MLWLKRLLHVVFQETVTGIIRILYSVVKLSCQRPNISEDNVENFLIVTLFLCVGSINFRASNFFLHMERVVASS